MPKFFFGRRDKIPRKRLEKIDEFAERFSQRYLHCIYLSGDNILYYIFMILSLCSENAFLVSFSVCFRKIELSEFSLSFFLSSRREVNNPEKQLFKYYIRLCMYISFLFNHKYTSISFLVRRQDRRPQSARTFAL